MTEPVLYFRNIRTLIQGICGSGGTGGVGAEAVDRDSDLFAVTFDYAVNAGGHGSWESSAGNGPPSVSTMIGPAVKARGLREFCGSG